VRVDDAEIETESCFASNTEVPRLLAGVCRALGVKLLTFSSDLVFDGKKQQCYVESDAVSPLNVYGKSKVMAEQAVAKINPDALIVRTSAFFGPWDRYNFVFQVLQAVRQNIPFSAAHDVYISPTYIPDLVSNSLDLLLDDAAGVWHMSNSGEVSWSTLAEEIAIRADCSRSLIRHLPVEDLRFRALRPKYSVLKSEKGMTMPSLDDALDRFLIDQEILTR
ncbi:MAG TPA: sugar nucleotide-binding protein, partial [Sphingobacteriaceae bacterium]